MTKGIKNCSTCKYWEPVSCVCCNGASFRRADFTLRSDGCAFWEKHQCRCGGTLEEREYNGKLYYHCYSCHSEFFQGGEK